METNTQKRFRWHVHHRILVEICDDYEGRVLYILTEKKEHQRDTRLRLLQPVKGNLPQEVIEVGLVYDKARQAHSEAGQAYDEAWQVYDEDEARQACDEAGQVYTEAKQAYYNEALSNNMPAVMLLHEEECPDCPWDGKTIFPGT